MIKQVFVVVAAFVLAACGPSDWERAQETNSVEGYRAFIAENADSEFVAAAQQRIEALTWDSLGASPTIEGYEEFLGEFPNSNNVEKAKAAITDLRWSQAESAGTVEALVAFARGAESGEQIARTRDAVKALANKDTKVEPLVELQGVFADNIVKYVQAMSVSYEGTIAGSPAKVSYAIQVGTMEDGMQANFVYQTENAIMAVPPSVPAVVQGKIDLKSEGKTVSFDLSGISLSSSRDLVGSYLIARNASMLWSDVEGLALLPTTYGETAKNLTAGEAVLFEVRPDFTLVYVP